MIDTLIFLECRDAPAKKSTRMDAWRRQGDNYRTTWKRTFSDCYSLTMSMLT